ncbi:MAG: helix-turn-helix domain-containing protein [Selenomonadaceae bacterium]|nr:helix-turn-helix domain-containing protein [Selenomonadaceae bacterium]
MLQYFVERNYKTIFGRGYTPRLEYICNVGADVTTMPRSMHEHKNLVEILLVDDGAGIFIIDGERYTAKKGDLILYNSGSVHDEFGGSGNDLSTYCVAVSNLKLVDFKTVNKILPDEYSPILPSGEYFDEMLNIFRAIERESYRPSGAETANLLTLALVAKICSMLKTHGIPRKQKEPSLTSLAKDFIDAHYTENIKLDDIARAVGTTVYRISKIFKAEIGIPPMRYVILRRMGEAQNLLINTDMTITRIAISVGYNDSNYFQNVFRDFMNMTPKEYRKRWTK